jgi:hypothetical protein
MMTINVSCGQYCAVYTVKVHPERVDHYKKYEHELNIIGLSFPLNIRQVKKFENLNPTISVNVFAYDGKVGVYPIHITAHKNRQHVNLLLLSQRDSKSLRHNKKHEQTAPPEG